MATLSADNSAATSPLCRPEEDPFLLLESTLHSVEETLLRRRGRPLRRSWIEQPYGEEEINLLEEEVLPAIQQCLARVDELDERLLAQQELMQRCELELQLRSPCLGLNKGQIDCPATDSGFPRISSDPVKTERVSSETACRALLVQSFRGDGGVRIHHLVHHHLWLLWRDGLGSHGTLYEKPLPVGRAFEGSFRSC